MTTLRKATSTHTILFTFPNIGSTKSTDIIDLMSDVAMLVKPNSSKTKVTGDLEITIHAKKNFTLEKFLEEHAPFIKALSEKENISK